MNKSRTEMAAKNVIWGYSNTLITTALKFICRWAFINTVGVTFLGINGLYSSILGVLSLTELGIGTAMNYSLYKPVAENDIEKIKSLMTFYKTAYRFVAAVIAVLGLSLTPFLQYLIKGADNVDHLTLYYLLFLFNTVSSYFVSYKYSLAGADQKYYIVNNINTVATILMNLAQIIVLFLFKSFLAYLIIQIVFLLFIKVYASFYLDKMYPFLKDKDVQTLDSATKNTLFRNVRALIVHKLGDVAVNQTDNIIISAVINIGITGLVSNYTLITGTVDSFLGILFGNITGSLGNLIATSDKKKQLEIFRVYDFVSFWLFGFAAIAYTALIQPFSELMWGEKYVVKGAAVFLIILNTYIVGQRVPLANMKIAAGVFQEDKLLPALQAVVNLAVSIVLAYKIGLVGVYVGTIVSGLVPTIIRPVIVYRKLFDQCVLEYFKIYIKHFFIILIIGLLNERICSIVLSTINWQRFILAMLITGLFPNVILLLIYRNSVEVGYLKRVGARILSKFLH